IPECSVLISLGLTVVNNPPALFARRVFTVAHDRTRRIEKSRGHKKIGQPSRGKEGCPSTGCGWSGRRGKRRDRGWGTSSSPLAGGSRGWNPASVTSRNRSSGGRGWVPLRSLTLSTLVNSKARGVPTARNKRSAVRLSAL